MDPDPALDPDPHAALFVSDLQDVNKIKKIISFMLISF
jgi:hypothetical protein